LLEIYFSAANVEGDVGENELGDKFEAAVKSIASTLEDETAAPVDILRGLCSSGV
jgi:hypothetical protein